MIKAGIIGSTGYAGQQLVWFLHRHKQVEIVFLCSHNYTDNSFSNVYGNYLGFIDERCINLQEVDDKLNSIDVLFLALPHGKSFDIVNKALSLGIKVIDLGSDFRLVSPEDYKKWYGLEHGTPKLLSSCVYGLPEIFKEEIKNAYLISNPGCYPTASILAISPLLKSGIIEPSSIIIDAKSGVSGAGRSANIGTLFAECNESVKAYGVAAHRHIPEIEQELSKVYGKDIVLSFTPHLIPMTRGILATCYANLNKSISQEEVYEIYNSFYKDEYFVRITQNLPETRWVKGSNFCDIGIRIDERTGKVIVISAIDNLIKGSAGQAVQNMNIAFNISETEGLDILAMVP